MPAPMIPLPIDVALPELMEALARGRSAVLVAPPGAGKTTRVPRAMLDAGMAAAGEVVVLQPRRLAARMAARRVADELGERVGETVGYQVRFEDVSSARTRVRFVTEGVLTRRLLSDPTLPGVAAVLLDEFHERHLHGDVALALLRRLQRGARPELRVVAMSATLDAAPVARFLDDAPVVHSEGRRFDVALEYLPLPDERPLAAQVAGALAGLLRAGLDGDVLVFLPGAAEIRRAREACEPLAARHGLLLVALHGDLPAAEQDRAVRPADRRKVILSTNVAETSVTVEGVVAVVDSGLARIASHAPWSGLPTLRVGRISRASAAQRAGRAGRTRPGRCLRLYTRHDHDTRPAHDAPEIARMDLAETTLELRASGVDDPATFPWFEAPPPAALAAAELLLRRLGALEPGSGRVTPLGRRMLRFPLHPRQSRIVVEAERRGVARDGCVLAALLGERDIYAGGGTRGGRRDARGRSDLLESLEAFDEAVGADLDPGRVQYLGLDVGAVGAVDRVQKQLVRLADARGQRPPEGATAYEDALLMAVLAGYPDRVGRRRELPNANARSAAGAEVVFATGGTAVLAESSVVRDAEFLVALDAEERAEGRGSVTRVRVASAVEPDWLLELFTDAVRDATEVRWNAAAERVEVVRTLAYEALVLEETRARDADPAAVARVLAAAAQAKGARAFAGDDDLDRFLARVAFVRKHCPGAELPVMEEPALAAALLSLCQGRWSLAELRGQSVLGALREQLTPRQQQQLAELAPERVTLPGGRQARVEYPVGQDPWLGSRLQDFFGMAQGPALAGGRVPLVLHLLAPNQRAVQVTTDLAGFWSKHYPAIARELRRKYPRQPWPDDPLHAAPPPPGPRRR